MDTNHQLVADRQAALFATANRGRLRRMFSRADGQSIDITVLESADVPTPAILLPARPIAIADTGLVHKVA